MGLKTWSLTATKCPNKMALCLIREAGNGGKLYFIGKIYTGHLVL